MKNADLQEAIQIISTESASEKKDYNLSAEQLRELQSVEPISIHKGIRPTATCCCCCIAPDRN